MLELGFKVKETKSTGDQGVDLILTKNNTKVGVQCKYYSKPVGNKAVQEIFTGKEFYNCTYGAVITNNDFTTSAKKLAYSTNILLIRNNRFKDVLKLNI